MMMSGYFRKLSCVLWLGVACIAGGGGVAAQTLISSNPSLRLLEIADNQGSTLIFDANTKTSTLIAANGNSISLTFSEMAEALYSSEQERTAYIASLVSVISDPLNHYVYTGVNEPTLNLPADAGDSGGVFQPNRSAEFWSTSASAGGPECAPFVINCGCLFGRCSPNRLTSGRIFYSWDLHSPRTPQPREMQRCEAQHRYNWVQQRNQACGRGALNAMEVTFATAVAAVGCTATVPSAGAAAALCLGGIGLAVVSVGNAFMDHRQCTAQYPGPPAHCRM